MNSIKKEDIFSLIAGLGFLSWALFIHFSNNRVFDHSDLRSLKIVLSDNPEYDIYKIKTTTYKEINLRAYGYDKVFKINNFTYKSVDHQKLKSELKKGDTISVWMPKSDIKNLRRTELVNNYNEIFGLVHKSQNLIDFEDRNAYQQNENRWGKLFLGLIGLIIIVASVNGIKKRLTGAKNP